MSDSNTRFELFAYWRSSSSWRVRIALNLKSVDYNIHPINLLKGEQQAADYQRINPMNCVPALVIYDTHHNTTQTIAQSTAIMEYLEELHPQVQPLLPPVGALYDRAVVRQLMGIIASDTQPLANLHILNRIVELSGREEEKQNWGQSHYHHHSRHIPHTYLYTASTNIRSICVVLCCTCDIGAETVTKGLTAFEELIAKTAGTYCYKDTITFADIVLVPQLGNARRFNVDVSAFPTCLRVESTLQQHPAFVKAHPDNQPDNPSKSA